MLHDFSCPWIFMTLILCNPTPRILENRAPITSGCFWTPTASTFTVIAYMIVDNIDIMY